MTITHDFENYDEDEANKRMNIIGQNGNTGEHYEQGKKERVREGESCTKKDRK